MAGLKYLAPTTSFVGRWDGCCCVTTQKERYWVGSGYVGPAVVRKPVDGTVGTVDKEIRSRGDYVLFLSFWKDVTVQSYW